MFSGDIYSDDPGLCFLVIFIQMISVYVFLVMTHMLSAIHCLCHLDITVMADWA